MISGNTRAQANGESLMEMDYESLVSIADLKINTVLPKHQYGLPIGNGRMGSLVWISNKLNQSKLKLQIGSECKIRNPWTDAEVLLKNDNGNTEVLKGQLLRFETEKGETIILSKTE